MDYEAVIGLEIHAQLRTTTKIFCSCRSVFGDKPNTHGCPVCMGLPGALPVLNRTAVGMAISMGLAVGCRIADKSIFARKNYFYPDLPKGYQISQYDQPLCSGGHVTIDIDGTERTIGLTRIHLEEDAGKLVHDQGPDSLFDVNRCGTPLIEIVSEPDIRSPGEAYAFLAALKQILSYLGICDCNMEEGSLRCDANVSLRPKGQEEFGVKTEVKNMNSFRGVERALQCEIERQEELLTGGGTVEQQTFLWDANLGRTVPMRTKEYAHDYRYFPDPDLVPLIVDQHVMERCREQLPELPRQRITRFVTALGLTAETASVLAESRDVADYFEKTLEHDADARTAANWVMGEILRMCKEKRVEIEELRTTPRRLAELLAKTREGTVSTSAAKRVLGLIEEQDKEPATVIEEQGLEQVSDASALGVQIDDILARNPEEAKRLQGGEKKLRAFFVGQAMRATKGKGNPTEINRLLSEKLGL